MRSAPIPELHGPFIKAPVWTWEVPRYFWVGGIESGSSIMALACDAAGDHRSAAVARKVALGAAVPAPVLLIGEPRPTRALPKHAADDQAALVDEHGRLVPGRAQRHGRARGGRGPCPAAADRPHARRGDLAAGRVSRLLHGRPSRLHGGACVGAEPGVSRAHPRRHRDRQRRSRSWPAGCPTTIRPAMRWARSRPQRCWPSSRSRRSANGGWERPPGCWSVDARDSCFVPPRPSSCSGSRCGRGCAAPGRASTTSLA
jgi:hypothetical protein